MNDKYIFETTDKYEMNLLDSRIIYYKNRKNIRRILGFSRLLKESRYL